MAKGVFLEEETSMVVHGRWVLGKWDGIKRRWKEGSRKKEIKRSCTLAEELVTLPSDSGQEEDHSRVM